MNIFPHGFLLELHALVTPATCEPSGDVFIDTKPGEFLLPPSLTEVVTRGEIADAQCFLGTESLTGSTEAETRLVNGPDYLAEVLATARQFGADANDEALILDMVLKLSEMLRRLSGDGIRRVRRTADTPGELLPVG